ncbi:MAG TPA: methylated-DNA--[protein]-cysteine S-methyltransferase [Acidimicrobiales bacterium]|nr:methylated-DNA--[protein]-cysteine S-methyltransferase [Acidimicrobiales bacterium]
MKTFIANVKSPVGMWSVVGTDEGVTHIHLPQDELTASKGAMPKPVADTVTQLKEYFAGSRRTFKVILAPSPATSFQRDVWAALRRIPYGQVRTYGEVADEIDRPRAHRAVGNANHANPWPIVVPCHRVVASSGLGGYGGGDRVKRYLLDLEGVHYD